MLFAGKNVAVKKHLQQYLKSWFFSETFSPKKHQYVRGDPRVAG